MKLEIAISDQEVQARTDLNCEAADRSTDRKWEERSSGVQISWQPQPDLFPLEERGRRIQASSQPVRSALRLRAVQIHEH